MKLVPQRAFQKSYRGGLPIGGVTEFTGLASSGRTSLAFALLGNATVESACAYIDVDDTVDPKSAAAAGVNLTNLLWVRVASVIVKQEVSAPVPSATDPVVHRDPRKIASGHCGSHHPRTETKCLDAALGKMLVQKSEARLTKMEGTPGYPNRKLSLAAAPHKSTSLMSISTLGTLTHQIRSGKQTIGPPTMLVSDHRLRFS